MAPASTSPQPVVVLYLIVEQLSYSALSSKNTRVSQFESITRAAVVESVPELANSSITVELFAGSVKANVTIVPPLDTTTTVVARLLEDAKFTIETKIFSQIREMEGIDDMRTGALAVTVTGLIRSDERIGCYDNDEALSSMLGRETTCNETVAEVCPLDLGLSLCPVSCSLCGPYRYKRMNKFIGPQVTILPLVVYQTRFQEKPCGGFASKYEDQPINTAQFFRPALDGERHGRLTTCIDRENRLENAYAIEVPCTNGPSSACLDGVYYDTPKQEHLNETVYPKLIANPSVDIARMKAIQWLDAQTGSVAITLLVYTEGLEIYTLVSVLFTFDAAGNVEPEVQLISWKEMHDESKGVIIATAVLAAFFALVGIIHNLAMAYQESKLKPDLAFEIFARFWLFVLSLSSMAWRLTRQNTADQYEAALGVQADVSDLSSKDGSSRVLRAFLDTAYLMHESASELDVIHILLCVAVVLQLVQLTIYFHQHPRTAVLSATMQRSLERLCYLAVLFVPFFFFLAFVAFWMFGFELSAFANFGQAMTSQLRMLYGDFLRAEGVPALSQADATMYWIHAVLFLVTVFLLLRFVFLAVVIDAFLETKSERPVVACSAPFDFADAVFSWFRWRRGSGNEFTHTFWGSFAWSSQECFLEWLEAWPTGTVLTTELLAGYFGSHDLSHEFHTYYCRKVPGIIHKDAAQVEPTAPIQIKPKLDHNRVAKRVVHEVTYRLAERDLKDVDRFVTIGRIACAISREFRDAGLIPG